MARTFDPVGAFQRGRANALAIQAAEQGIAAEKVAAPKRNQLADLKLSQAKVGAERRGKQFDQQQALQASKVLNNTLTALRGLPIEQRDAAFTAIAPQLQQFGVDVSGFEPGEFTDIDLEQGIAQTQAFLGQPQVAKQTTLERNLISAGLTPGTKEFQDAVLGSVAPPTTIIGSGEKEESKALARQRVEKFGQIQQSAEQATNLLDSLNQLDAIDVQTGALEPAKVAIASIAEGFGIDASAIANATTAQAFNAVSTRLVNDVLNAATGPQTDQDATRARQTIASLGDTPGAATFKNDSLRSLALRQIEQRDFISSMLDQDKNLSSANKEWREFKRKTPSLSSVVKGPNGLPLFFFQFKGNAKTARPGISDQEIINAWRQVHGK